MDTERIAELLQPFLPAPNPLLLEQLKVYLDLLLRWNARTNLTAVRGPEEIVTRHFGESLFAARVLFGADPSAGGTTLADIGSGAGFPGIPVKLFVPGVRLTLIESQNKKSTFLREVIRTLGLSQAEVFSGRAEDWGGIAEIITLRAVEQFERTLPTAARLVGPGGRLCLLIGTGQASGAKVTLGHYLWEDAVPAPGSVDRVVIVGRNQLGITQPVE